MTLFFCTLPHASPVHACGPWTAIATGLPGFVQQAGLGSFPVISGDVAVYVLNGGFGYYRFSSGTNTNVTTSQPHGLNTNGAIIVFSSGSPETIKYYDTSAPAGSRAIVDTGLQGRYPSITQYTIAFEDLAANPIRIRYYDVIRNQASPAGTGPVGELTYGSSAIWGDRIVFRVDETDDNFDCNGDGTISSSEYCLGYWNIRSPSWVATTLAAKAAPGVNSYPVIFDKTVAFTGSNGDLQYVTVPMQGDVNLDGVVDNTDKTTVTGCLNQLLKGTVC